MITLQSPFEKIVIFPIQAAQHDNKDFSLCKNEEEKKTKDSRDCVLFKIHLSIILLQIIFLYDGGRYYQV